MSEAPKFEIKEALEYKERVAFEIDAIKAIILGRLDRTEFHAIPQDILNDELLDIIARLSIDLEDLKEKLPLKKL